MKNNYSKEDIENTLDGIFKVLDNIYIKRKRRRLNDKEMFEFATNLHGIFNIYTEIDYKDCSARAKKKYIPFLNMAIALNTVQEYKMTYHEYLENAYKLAGRYDFESFVIYYEWYETDKFYEPRYEILGGYAYYLDKMVKDPNFELIIANLPSGAGKTYLEKLAEAYSYGIDDTGTMLALCSNDDVVRGGSRTVKDIMKSERYGDVFPHLRFTKGDRDYFIKETEKEWKLKKCKLSASYYAETTNSNVVGIRASKWIHIDDLYADYKEALDENLNIYYYNKLATVWRKRYVQGKKAKLVITGTMWSPNDFMVKVISLYKSRETFIKHPKFKYCWISLDKSKVIIQVPALDPETNETSCKALWSTAELEQERASMDTYLWETNFQQNPTTPEALEFDYKNLITYDMKPANDYGATYAVIDGTRKSGKDYFSMPILQPYGEEDYALVDCIYTQIATSELIDDILKKIVDNRIKILVIETNVDGGLKKTLNEKLKEVGYKSSIEIIEEYSTVVKATRIELEKGNIKNHIVFPARGMYGMNTPLGKFMNSFTIYNSQGRNEHDDACFDGDTLIATQFGYKKIKDIKIGDKVITPAGLRKVVDCGITGYKPIINKFGLNATANHKVYNCKKNDFMPLKYFKNEQECSKLTLKNLKTWREVLYNIAEFCGTKIKFLRRYDLLDSRKILITHYEFFGSFKMSFIMAVFKFCNLFKHNKKQTTPINDAVPVYNLKVEGIGCYYANNILVSNCDSLAMFTSKIIAGKAMTQKARVVKRIF